MTYTTHGHHIQNSVDVCGEKPEKVARCGGPSVCPLCSAESSQWQAAHVTLIKPKETFGPKEDTMLKVYQSLRTYGLEPTEASLCIADMQNKGILFLERL